MDWYFESAMEDLAVPKVEEIFDRLPSPHSWTSWGNMIGEFNSQEKRNAFGVEELPLSGTMFSSAVEQHSPPNIRQDSKCTSRQRSACPHEYSNIELDDLPIMDDADDIFLYNDSLFEVDARAWNEAECSANSTQNPSDDDLMDTLDLLRERNHVGDSLDDDETHFLPEKELDAEFCVLDGQCNAYTDISEEYISREETLLLELQGLTVQMAKNTRIGFRDSLYRLAENSRYRAECSSWNGEDDPENCEPSTKDEPSRFGGSNSDTNAIDRTVATLLFDTTKFCNPPSASTSDLEFADTLKKEYQANACLYQPTSCVSSLQEGDAEVPTFGLTNQNPVMWS